MKQLLLSSTFTLLLATCLLAQSRTVSGRITDAAGAPLPGATVLVKDAGIGTTGDANGSYSLAVPAAYTLLVFSFLGFAPQEVEIGDRTLIDVQLEEASNELDEVVVIGFGSQSKRRVTSSVASVGEEAFENVPASDFQNALSGRLPGVVFTNSSGSTNSA
jgi:hypothetical protein